MKNRNFVFIEAEKVFNEYSNSASDNDKIKENYSKYLLENGVQIKEILNKQNLKEENKLLKIIKKIMYIIL